MEMGLSVGRGAALWFAYLSGERNDYGLLIPFALRRGQKSYPTPK